LAGTIERHAVELPCATIVPPVVASTRARRNVLARLDHCPFGRKIAAFVTPNGAAIEPCG
jgi:hypothetical protein